MKKNQNPLADGNVRLGLVRAPNRLLIVWRESIWGMDGGVTFDGRTTMGDPATAAICAREMIPPTGCDHVFDPNRARVVEGERVNECMCGCGLVYVERGGEVLFFENLARFCESKTAK